MLRDCRRREYVYIDLGATHPNLIREQGERYRISLERLATNLGIKQNVSFFNRFRDLTASGFWSTKMGVADLQYQGNVFVDEWNGCPTAALDGAPHEGVAPLAIHGAGGQRAGRCA